MSSIGFPDGQRITQWLGAPIEQAAAFALGAGAHVAGPFKLASWASVIVSCKPTGGAVDVTVTQQISGGPPGLQLSETFHVAAGATLFEAIVLFGDAVTVSFQGAAAGETLDYAIYPSNTTTNANVITQATINVQHNDALVAAEPTLDFEDASQSLWTLTDDAPNTRMKLALLAGVPSVLVSNSLAVAQGNNGGGTGGFLPMTFDTDTWDTDGFHDPAVNPTRLQVPAGLAGKYAVLAFATWDPNAAGIRQSTLRKNGATIGPWSTQAGSVAGGRQDYEVMGFVSLAVGDYLELGVYQSSGVALNIFAGAQFGMFRIGP